MVLTFVMKGQSWASDKEDRGKGMAGDKGLNGIRQVKWITSINIKINQKGFTRNSPKRFTTERDWSFLDLLQ